MPGLFSEFALKDVRLRNRVAVSPMTQYSCGPDGVVTDWHLVHLGARAIGGAGLVVVEQAAVSPEGRMTNGCLGLWNDEQAEALARIARFIRSTGAVPGIQLGHSGRKGSISRPWEGYSQLPTDHPDAWEPIGPSPTPFGGRFPRGARAMTQADIDTVQAQFAAAARRALNAGFDWVELHYAHGFLGASFFSPIANQRTDAYGGSPENRARFLLETFDAVRSVWPERLPLTARIGALDFHPDSHTLEDSIDLVRALGDRGLDLIDISMGMNTEEATVPFAERGFMLPAAGRIRRETGVPTAASWNLADPAHADQVIGEGLIDLLMIGRPMLANPHWPYYAAMLLGENAPLDLMPEQYRYFLAKAQGVPHASGFAGAMQHNAPPR
ncbi:MAG: NADH:flavin oxidoreductase/NADH oxidase [Proteobacteria bacterium]|nr:NADH:flavin oxidoreductase/NADH oxidase [Pseudomonadota bacterium]